MELKASGDAMSADVRQAQLVQGIMIEDNGSLQQLQDEPKGLFCIFARGDVMNQNRVTTQVEIRQNPQKIIDKKRYCYIRWEPYFTL